MTLQAQADLLNRSTVFDPDWYCETYPDVPQSGLDPALHFLKYGNAWGRNPGAGFDTAFYIERYPDVAQHDIVPLVHYLSQGQQEGRHPTPQAERTRLGMETVRKLQAALWGGLEDQAIPQLQAIAKDPETPEAVHFEAEYLLAVWLDFQGDEEGARRALGRMGGLSAAFSHSARRLIPQSILLARHGLIKAARNALERVQSTDHEADRRLALANLEPDAPKLARINSLYEARGLCPLERRDSTRPLTLDNLTTTPCLPELNNAGMGKVSVIVPAYKASTCIETALRSLCAQTHWNLEIIVVDDASPDDTFDKIKALAQNDPRIIPVQQPENKGAYAARNRGLEIACGDFITTHDADDWSHPQKISTQLQALAEAPDLMGVLTHWARVRAPFHFTTNWRLGHALLQWSHSSFLVRRAVVDALGGWEEIRVSADMEFIWRVEAAFGVGAIRRLLPDIPMAFALDDAESLTRNADTHVRSTYVGLRHYYREISRYWHEKAPEGLTDAQKTQKWAMLPAQLKPNADLPIKVDHLVKGDCCNPQVLSKLVQLAEQHPEGRIGISHVPDPKFQDRQSGYAIEFPDPFFELLMRSNVVIASTEAQVQATTVQSL